MRIKKISNDKKKVSDLMLRIKQNYVAENLELWPK